MKNVLFRAPVLTQSGYGVHARQIARWLLSRSDINVSFQMLNWGKTPWYINRDDLGGLVGEIMQRSRPLDSCDVSFQLQLPNEWDVLLATKNVGITAAIETDRANPQWVTACNNMDTVVFPSQHAKKSLDGSGNLTVSSLVIPEAYTNACCLETDSLPKINDFNTSFNILVFGQITATDPTFDRKNTFNTIKWLCEEFKDNKDVGIVLKTNMGRNSKIDRKYTKSILNQVISASRKRDFPRVYLVHGDMSDEEVVALYKNKSIKVMVSLTRGEGFGLPLLEAAACDLPIIATNWSGHTEFLNRGKFIPIFYDLKQIPPNRVDNKLFISGARWAEPNENDFKRRVKKFYNNPATPREWATNLGKIIRTEYSQKRIVSMYNEAFSEILT